MESTTTFSDGDICWVKLGNCWWPGQVIGTAKWPDEISQLKKPPIAVVRFFQEDTFEYVKNISNINKYDCTKKMEYIKKGKELHRAGHKYMEKFPGDVAKAEELTGGNPNILESKELDAKKRTSNNWADIFSDSKSPKNKLGSSSKSIDLSPTVTPKKVEIINSVRTLISATPPQRPAETHKYQCNFCNFSTDRINLIILHHKSHSNSKPGTSNETPEKKTVVKASMTSKPTPKVKAKAKSPEPEIQIPEDIPIPSTSRRGRSSGKKSDIIEEPLQKNEIEQSSKSTPKIATSRKKAKKEEKPVVQKQTSPKTPKKRKSEAELRKEILADWSDFEEPENESDQLLPNTSKTTEKNDKDTKSTMSQSTSTVDTAASNSVVKIRNIPKKQRLDLQDYFKFEAERIEEKPLIIEDIVPDSDTKPNIDLNVNESKTCFDFKEEEEPEFEKYDLSKLRHNKKEKKSTSPSKTSEIDNEKLTAEIESIMNETEVPTFSNDIEIPKRSLPPKERNKRIFKSKSQKLKSEDSSPENTIMTPENKNASEKEKLNISISLPEIKTDHLLQIPKKKHLRILKEAASATDTSESLLEPTSLEAKTETNIISSTEADVVKISQESVNNLITSTEIDVMKISQDSETSSNTSHSKHETRLPKKRKTSPIVDFIETSPVETITNTCNTNSTKESSEITATKKRLFNEKSTVVKLPENHETEKPKQQIKAVGSQPIYITSKGFLTTDILNTNSNTAEDTRVVITESMEIIPPSNLSVSNSDERLEEAETMTTVSTFMRTTPKKDNLVNSIEIENSRVLIEEASPAISIKNSSENICNQEVVTEEVATKVTKHTEIGKQDIDTNQLEKSEDSTPEMTDEIDQLKENEETTIELTDKIDQLKDQDTTTEQEEKTDQLKENEDPATELTDKVNQLKENEDTTIELTDEIDQLKENDDVIIVSTDEIDQLKEKEDLATEPTDKVDQENENKTTELTDEIDKCKDSNEYIKTDSKPEENTEILQPENDIQPEEPTENTQETSTQNENANIEKAEKVTEEQIFEIVENESEKQIEDEVICTEVDDVPESIVESANSIDTTEENEMIENIQDKTYDSDENAKENDVCKTEENDDSCEKEQEVEEVHNELSIEEKLSIEEIEEKVKENSKPSENNNVEHEKEIIRDTTELSNNRLTDSPDVIESEELIETAKLLESSELNIIESPAKHEENQSTEHIENDSHSTNDSEFSGIRENLSDDEKTSKKSQEKIINNDIMDDAFEDNDSTHNTVDEIIRGLEDDDDDDADAENILNFNKKLFNTSREEKIEVTPAPTIEQSNDKKAIEANSKTVQPDVGIQNLPKVSDKSRPIHKKTGSSKRQVLENVTPEKLELMTKEGMIQEIHGKKRLTEKGVRKMKEQNLLKSSKKRKLQDTFDSEADEDIAGSSKDNDDSQNQNKKAKTENEDLNDKNTSSSDDLNLDNSTKEETSEKMDDASELSRDSNAIDEDQKKSEEELANTSASSENQNGQEDPQIFAVPAENFGGPPNAFYLCANRNELIVPIDFQLLYLDASNQLVPYSMDADDQDNNETSNLLEVESDSNTVVINTPNGQMVLDQQTLLSLAAESGETVDGQQQIVLSNDILAALLSSQGIESGTAEILIPEILANNPNITMIDTAAEHGLATQFHSSPGTVQAQVSETNAVLTQRPRMATKIANQSTSKTIPAITPTTSLGNIEDSLATIGVTQSHHTVPTSLELPITVTNPIIADSVSRKMMETSVILTDSVVLKDNSKSDSIE